MTATFGFDIDGVLTDDDDGTSNIWMVEASRYFNRPLIKPSFYLHEAVGVTRQEIDRFIEARSMAIMENVSIRPHCLNVLRRLKSVYCDIHLITARKDSCRNLTEAWLGANQIPYDSLTMKSVKDSHYSKGTICQHLEVDLFVDDNYENCLELKQSGIYTLMYHCSHNQDKQAPVPVVRDWHEIETSIYQFHSTRKQRA